MKRIVCFMPAIIIMCAIFFFSAQEATVSTQTSTSLGRGLITFRNACLGIEMSEEMLEQKALAADHFIRKSAHATEYMILALSITIPMIAGVILTDKTLIYRFVMGFVLTALYSITDEVHQLFVRGRSGQVKDVIIDSIGALIGVLIVAVVSKINKNNTAQNINVN